MPSLSINKSDLEDLGISLKDILTAIPKSKQSGGDVIKIKKRKKVKKRKKIKKNPQVQSQSQFKPFPNQTAAGGGGGGFGFNNAIPNVTKVEVRSDPQPNNQKSDETHKQLQLYHSEISGKLNDMKKQQDYNTYGLRTMGEYILTNGLQGQNNPPPSSLSYIPRQSLRSPVVEEVDVTDRFGNIPSNDPYVDFQFDSQPTDDANLDSNAVDIQPSDPTELNQFLNESQPDQTEQPADEPVEDIDPFPQPTIEPQPKLKQDVFELMKQGSLKQQQELELAKKRGRPVGSKNKSKSNPLSSEAISETSNVNTRSNQGALLNQTFQTTDRIAKEATTKATPKVEEGKTEQVTKPTKRDQVR